MRTLYQHALLLSLCLLTILTARAQSAGPDQTICQHHNTTMAATGTGIWRGLPTNPSVAGFYNSTSATSMVFDLDSMGVYGFTWGNTTVDTMYITIRHAPSLPHLSLAGPCLGHDSLIVSRVTDADSILWYRSHTLVHTSAVADSVYHPTTVGVYSAYTMIAGGCSSVQSLDTFYVDSVIAASVTVAGQYTICSGAADSFTATPVNGGATPSYQWYRNGTAVGTSAPVYGTTTLADHDSIWVAMTSSYPCASPTIAMSSKFYVRVNATPAAPVLASIGSCLADTLVVHQSSGALRIDWYQGATQVSADTQAIITVAGGNGSGSSATQLQYPQGVFVDAAGAVYVSDPGNHRVQKFPAGSTSATSGVTVAGGNGNGTGLNQIGYPTGIWVDPSGNLYVSDQTNDRVMKFPAGSTSATSGVVIGGGNGQGTAANQLRSPMGLEGDASGNIYVADGNGRIQKFPAGSTSATMAVTVAGGNGAGSAANQLYYPYDVALDAIGNLYVADLDNDRVQKFPAGSTSATNGITIAGGNGNGSNNNQLNQPEGIALDAAGNLYVCDNNDRVQMFPPGSTSATAGVTVAGGHGSGPAANQFIASAAIALDSQRNIYVADLFNNRVQKWSHLPVDTEYVPVAYGSYTAVTTASYGCKSAPSNAVVVAPCLSDSVWPGDADHNGVADNNDLLPIGTAYGLNGIARVDQSIVWTAHAATNWGVQFLSGENTKHADCNGNGVIDANDTTAILTNFGLVHSKTDGAGPWRSGIPGITLRYSKDTVVAGDTLVTTLILGDSVSSVSGLYGLAFTFHYDPLVCDSMTTSFVFPNSFLGTPSTKMSLHKDFRTAGEVKAAVTGIDHLNRSGYGAIATFSCIITTDNLNGKDLLYYTNKNYISDIKAVDKDGITLPLNGAADSNSVGYEPSGIHAVHTERVSLYPNPAASQVSIMAQSAITQVTLTDVLGQQALSQSGRNATTQTLDISALAAGVYTVHITTLSGSGTARLVVTQ
ncbi:MAG: T9SS type A sorting domain-containing protein [Bacteroidetes bacterium]|nr:T9SS type A sorting domain-containing protein [Bacteroidota bacterium]